MKSSTKEPHANKSRGVEEQGFKSYQPSQWYRPLLCQLRMHRGVWTYATGGSCDQWRNCTVCGQTQRRTKHTWDHKRDYAAERHECTRCGKFEIWGTTREDLITGLHAAGVSARLAKRGRFEENTGKDSMGLIDIEHSPISWINVRKWDNEGPVYETDLGMPDSRSLPDVSIRSVRVRAFPVFGNVIDVRWQGNDTALSVAQHLTADPAIRADIIANRDEITVRTCPQYGCWLIPRSTKNAPSASQWHCYEKIAANLLTSPLTQAEK
jgi:hypothetical protein